MENKDIYSMKLHEVIEIKKPYGCGSFDVIRVPGGWIYFTDSQNRIFVPYSNEFNPYQKQSNL